MKRINVELFGDEGNFSTVRMPCRASAGVVFQLDSLGRLAGDIQEAVRLLREARSSEALAELEATYSEFENILSYAKLQFGQSGQK